MSTKPKKTANLSLLLTLLVIVFLMFWLYKEYHRKREHSAAAAVAPARNMAEALEQTEQLRKRPDFAWPASPAVAELQLIQHRAFSLGYSEEHEQAAWVGYLLSRLHTKNSHERRNNFRADPLVGSGSADPRDYAGSGYDRGHLAPAADFDYSKEALQESFYMSNMSPQKPSFNRGGWKELEELVRQWAIREDSLWVLTGPVLSPGLKKIGDNKVSVPLFYYKIILDPRLPQLKMISFLMPNKKITAEAFQWVVPVDSVEALTGLDFFPQLPDLLEDSLEGQLQTQYWFKK